MAAAVWKVRLTVTEAPALQGWLAEGGARLGDLLRNPDDRDEPCTWSRCRPPVRVTTAPTSGWPRR